MSPPPSDAEILAKIPADGISFPDLARALEMTQRKLHPLVARLVARGEVLVELQDGIRWIRRGGAA